jgi:hypothetical protein
MRPDFPTGTVALDDRMPLPGDAVPRGHHLAWNSLRLRYGAIESRGLTLAKVRQRRLPCFAVKFPGSRVPQKYHRLPALPV